MTKAENDDKPARKPSPDGRDERLAAALRRNLRRRKEKPAARDVKAPEKD